MSDRQQWRERRERSKEKEIARASRKSQRQTVKENATEIRDGNRQS